MIKTYLRPNLNEQYTEFGILSRKPATGLRVGMPAEAQSITLNLPNEILLLIFEHSEFDSLRTVSIANKHLHQLCNLRLWRKLSLDLDSLFLSRRYLGICAAMIRDPNRARCVKTLSIHVSRKQSIQGVASALRPRSENIVHLPDVLPLLESLRTLRIDAGHLRNWRFLSQMLSTHAHRFPFSLLELDLDQPPRDAFRVFLESQDSIESYSSGRWPRGDRDDALDMSQFLPHLRSVKGPRGVLKDVLRGRQLQLVVLGRSGDLVKHGVRLRKAYPQYTGSLSDCSAGSLATVHEVHIRWPIRRAREDQLIPFLISKCGISPISISRLSLYSDRWPNATSFSDVIFKELPNLVDLQLECNNQSSWDGNTPTDFIRSFAQDDVLASSSLCSLTMTSHFGDNWTFWRVGEGVAKNDHETDSQDIAFTDTRGSTWFQTVRTDYERW